MILAMQPSQSPYDGWIAIIPAKNEAATIAHVVEEVLQQLPGMSVVVIDDASTDNTGDLARGAGAVVIPLAVSLGAWGAAQTGLRYAQRRGYLCAITLDADGQHRADSLPVLADALRARTADVIIGAYPARGSFARRLAWSLFRKVSGLSLVDLTSGLRAYNRTAIQVLASRQATLLDYQDMGVLLLLAEKHLITQEVAIDMQPRLSGHSRIFRSWWTVAGYMLQTLILCIARSRHPWPARPHALPNEKIPP